MPEKNRSEIVTPEFRLSFPSLFRASSFGEGKPAYSLVMLAPKENAKAWEPLRTRIREVIAQNYEGTPTPVQLKKFSPFRDGDEEKPHLDGYPGCMFIRTASEERPRVIDTNQQDIIEERKVYAGSYARAVVQPYWRKRKDNPGVSLGLIMVQWLRDGEPFGRTTGDPEDYFGPPQDGAAAGNTEGFF